MKAILFCLAMLLIYSGLIAFFTGTHPHGKSDKVLDAEMDVQMENLKQRTQNAQLDALRRRGL